MPAAAKDVRFTPNGASHDAHAGFKGRGRSVQRRCRLASGGSKLFCTGAAFVFGSKEISAVGSKEVQERPDLMCGLSGVPHRRIAVDQVVVASPVTAPFDDAGRGEVRHDPLGRALGDPDRLGDVPEPDVAVLCDLQKHLRVIGEERPGPGVLLFA